MKMRACALLLLVIGVAIMASSAGAAQVQSPDAMATQLSDPSVLATSSETITDSTGSYIATSSAALDTAVTNATIGSDGYLCGNVGYNATYRWKTLGGLLTSWTYRSHFAVHVCHDKVTGLVSLYDEPVDSIPTWSWCGSIVRSWAMNPNNASAHSYTKGCFALYDKVVVAEYPWAKMTIGGNGGLWVRTTGVN